MGDSTFRMLSPPGTIIIRGRRLPAVIIENKIIAHGKDVKKVYQEAKSKFPKSIVFLGQVPRKEALIL